MTEPVTHESIASVLEGQSLEIMLATRKADALVVAASLRELANQCERLAEILPVGVRRKE